jgi:DNA polymerase III delta prime subunit
MYTHHRPIIEKLDYFYHTQKIPNIIIHGSSGTGKRTLVYDFINKIYNHDKQKIKMNVMTVNCAHGKGIKFIREDLKFFAKTNVQSNSGILFKSIILLNADFLTIDAQSALRRCIELFSHNTRFFIIVENKNKLLNPILSRFCEIYVPELVENGKVVNLHRAKLDQKYPMKQRLYEWLRSTEIIPDSSYKTQKEGAEASQNTSSRIKEGVEASKNTSSRIKEGVEASKNTSSRIKEWVVGAEASLRTLVSLPVSLPLQDLAAKSYEEGLSCLDIIQWLDQCPLDESRKTQIKMEFHKLRGEFRCEKMLMFILLYKIRNS